MIRAWPNSNGSPTCSSCRPRIIDLVPGARGLDNAVDLISSSNQKDSLDAQWADDAGVKEYFAFMKQYLPNADLNNSNYAAGYHYANLMTRGAEGMQGRLQPREHPETGHLASRTPTAHAAAGITVSTGPDDYLPFQQLRLRRFNGKSWVGFGEILDDR